MVRPRRNSAQAAEPSEASPHSLDGNRSRRTEVSESDSEEELRAVRPQDVTVAIFCALAHEAVAVKHALDERLGCALPGHGQPHDYVYSYGRLAGHTVVVARTTQTGPVGAALCAAAVGRQFPNVRMALAVGIGAGIPSDRRDVRLGDVAVSVPRGDHPGVLEFDAGGYEADGEFVRKGALNCPPDILLSADGSLEEDELEGKNPIRKILRRITKHRGYERPTSVDVLFEKTFPHLTKGSDCRACKASGHKKVVSRKLRLFPYEPVVHRGLILSGSGMVKNPEDRERLRRGYEDAVCYETAAAGIMNRIPCLVIRGICDYADTHRQDEWHFYAAAAAAAHCKAVLRKVPGGEVEPAWTPREVVAKGREPRMLDYQMCDLDHQNGLDLFVPG